MFFNATVEEMKKLNLDKPTKILFGHSHIPINAESPYDLKPFIPDLYFYNTGGWLTGKAELFFIDDNDINSISI